MHTKRANIWAGPDPVVVLTFLTDDWRGSLVIEVRYKGPGLHLTVVTNPSAGMLLQGGDWTEVNRAVDQAYNDLVQNKARQ